MKILTWVVKIATKTSQSESRKRETGNKTRREAMKSTVVKLEGRKFEVLAVHLFC
jgi:hypothetical protein